MSKEKPWYWLNHPSSADWPKRTDDYGLIADMSPKLDQPIVRDGAGNVVRVPNGEPSAIIREAEIIKGERAANGYRSYWLVENGEIKKSVSALTDDEANKLLSD